MTTTQHQAAWERIHSAIPAKANEFQRLLPYWRAAINAPRMAVAVTTKRSVKFAGIGKGQRHLKVYPTIKCDVPLERVFINHK